MKITAALFLAHLSYDNILKVFKVNVQAGTETGRSVILKPGPGPHRTKKCWTKSVQEIQTRSLPISQLTAIEKLFNNLQNVKTKLCVLIM